MKIGDKITFRAPTRGNGNRKATRVINGFWFSTGDPTVCYHGYNDFVVRSHEILEVIPERKC